MDLEHNSEKNSIVWWHTIAWKGKGEEPLSHLANENGKPYKGQLSNFYQNDEHI